MRLINADKFDAVLSNIFDHLYESGRTDLAGTLAAFADLLKQQPTIDAVPVVRCKDCNHRADATVQGNYLCNRKMLGLVRPDDFCSFGDRKDSDS